MFTLKFSEVTMKDLPKVGGKNASLGEMYQKLSSKGVRVPPGFATTSNAYWDFLDQNNIRSRLTDILKKLDRNKFSNLNRIGKEARQTILKAKFSSGLKNAILDAFNELGKENKGRIRVAVRSSATAEDLPTASFAGQLESYLNIKGKQALLDTCLKCYASLFTDRAIKYREDHGFKHMDVALSIGVQLMVRSDKACSGVGFTLEPETGFGNVIILNGIWGLGENIVQGKVNPDEFTLFKPALVKGMKSIISKRLGSKRKTMIYSTKERSVTVKDIDTPISRQSQYVLTDEEIVHLGQWCLEIERHYKRPMDIEWAKDGISGELFIVQARPETVHSSKKNPHIMRTYHLKEKGRLITSGVGLGSKISCGKARILHSPSESGKLKKGEVLVTDVTNPDWDPVMKKAAAIVTNKGGRTSHAAIVARELEVVAIVGTDNATKVIKEGEQITVSCAEGEKGNVYAGRLSWTEKEINTEKIKMPETDPMFILAHPDQAYRLSFLPNRGVGLMRLEFVISNVIKIHPMALVNYPRLKDKVAKKQITLLTDTYKDKTDYFIDRLSQAIATIAAAFYPKDVIVRMSDFKSNEYASLIGGNEFEPKEENPMMGWRGASRYYSEGYKAGFNLECKAIKLVRDEMGLNNVKLMIPFCRTVEEGKKVIKLMSQNGLKQGKDGLEIYVMIEIPSNVVLADQFANIFDGFSIGSNDLTQLTLGISRDSEILSDLFDVNNEAVRQLIADTIKSARKNKIKVGLCGQAPSDYPEFAKFLVEQGISSISFNPDALLKGIENMNKAETKR